MLLFCPPSRPNSASYMQPTDQNFSFPPEGKKEKDHQDASCTREGNACRLIGTSIRALLQLPAIQQKSAILDKRSVRSLFYNGDQDCRELHKP